MKRIFSMSLASLFLGAALIAAPAASATGCVGFADGDGSQADPYQISNRVELEALDACYATGNYFLQTADIDLGGAANLWTPIGTVNAFRGNYDGGNYEIQNMHVVRQWNAGMFDGTNAATFTRVRLVDYSVSSVQGGYAGGLAAFSRDTVVSKTIIRGSVTSTGITGGLIGVHWGGQLKQISEIFADVTVVGGGNGAGGIVGESISASSIIEDVFVTGTVTGTSFSAGGVVGYGQHSALRRAVSTATISGSVQYRGGVAGYFGGAGSVFVDSFHLDTAVTPYQSNYPTSRTSTQLATLGAYANFDIGTAADSATKWRIVDGVNQGLPFLSFTTINNQPPVAPTPVPYSGPILMVNNQQVVAGGLAEFSGERLAGITAVSIGGQKAVVESQTNTGLSVKIPAGLAAGSYDLVVISEQGQLTVQSAVVVLERQLLPVLQSPTPELRTLSADSIKVYVFEASANTKVQILHNGREIAWVNTGDRSHSKLRSGYLVRTIELEAGVNLLQVLVAGEVALEQSLSR
jgi:hypothetical protein